MPHKFLYFHTTRTRWALTPQIVKICHGPTATSRMRFQCWNRQWHYGALQSRNASSRRSSVAGSTFSGSIRPTIRMVSRN